MYWKDIKETFGIYEISSCGKVRRKTGIVDFGENKRKVGGKILSPKTKSNGYLEVSLCFNKKQKSFYIHRLVASNWIGDIGIGMCVNHKDGNKTNNNVSNLEIVTQKENNYHAKINGLNDVPWSKGENHPMAKIDENTARLIKKMKIEGFKQKYVREKLEISKSIVEKIYRGETWKHI